MAEEIIIEEILKKNPTNFGNASHIILPKRYKDRTIYILIAATNLRKPYIHYDRIKEIDGKTYYQGEISDSAGTHSFWVEKSKVKKIFTRNT